MATDTTLARVDTPRLWWHEARPLLMRGTPPAQAIICCPQDGAEVDLERSNLDERQIFHWISSSQPDSFNDIISQGGIQFERFNRNPIWLNSHRYWSLPIGRSVEHGLKGGRAFSIVEFWGADDLEHGQLCETLFRLTAEKFMKGCSLGGRMLEYTINKKRGGLDIKELELYEVSKVNVPANALAVARAAAASDIDLDPLLQWSYQLLEEAQGTGATTDETAPVLLSRSVADELAEYVGYGSALELVQFDASEAQRREKAADPSAEHEEVSSLGASDGSAEDGVVRVSGVVDRGPGAFAQFTAAADRLSDLLERRFLTEEELLDAASEPTESADSEVEAETAPDVLAAIKALPASEWGEILKELVTAEVQRHQVQTTGRLPDDPGGHEQGENPS